jgi:hypothetical protein
MQSGGQRIAQFKREVIGERVRDKIAASKRARGRGSADRTLSDTVDYFNRDPVVHTWTYKLDEAA